MTVLGIDIGGSGIKGAPVDVDVGALTDERYRLETPRPATPEAVASVLAEVAGHWKGADAMGVTFPGVVRNGVIGTAANLDPSWIGVDAAALFTQHTGRRAIVLNDADAAGVAEVAFGAGRDVRGVVLLLTFGTGIGSALFVDGRLVPNTELGHLELNGADAELHVSDRIREEQDLSWSGLGRPRAGLPAARGAPAGPGPDRPRWRGQQEGRPVPAATSRWTPRSSRRCCRTTPGSSGRRWRPRRPALRFRVPPVTVREGTRADRRAAGDVLGAAFQVEPVYAWLFRGPGAAPAPAPRP